jgi:hypothetical protein
MLLPSSSRPWAYMPDGGPDWEGFEGSFTSLAVVEPFVAARARRDDLMVL